MSMSLIRALITRDALQSSKPLMLFKSLRTRIINGDDALPPLFVPNPGQLREILSALADHATSEYLRNMADDDRYTNVIQKWLRSFAKDPEEWEPAIVPMLRV